MNLKEIYRSPLFKVMSLNSISIFVRMAGGFLASKMTAEFIGPAGLALVGNLRSFLTSLDTFSTIGFQNGIIKYSAENKDNEHRLYRSLATVFIAIFAMILLLSILLLAFSSQWGIWIFGSSQFAWVFKVLAFSLPWYTGNLVFMAILNGLGRYKKVIGINIWGNISGVLLSALMIWKLGVTGAFLGLIAYPALMFIFSFYLLSKTFPRFPFLRLEYFDKKILQGLFSYSGMTIISALLTPVVYIAMRNNLMENFNEKEAGFWEGMNRISSFYLMFVSTLLTLYFLPKLSQSKSDTETRSVLTSYYKGIVPVFAAGLIAMYVFRKFIIPLILSDEFLPMEKLFAWQLLADLIKACTLILGYELLAKKAVKAFVLVEIVSFSSLYILAHYLIKQYGSEGAVMAQAFTAFIVLTILGMYSFAKLRPKKNPI